MSQHAAMNLCALSVVIQEALTLRQIFYFFITFYLIVDKRCACLLPVINASASNQCALHPCYFDQGLLF